MNRSKSIFATWLPLIVALSPLATAQIQPGTPWWLTPSSQQPQTRLESNTAADTPTINGVLAPLNEPSAFRNAAAVKEVPAPIPTTVGNSPAVELTTLARHQLKVRAEMTTRGPLMPAKKTVVQVTVFNDCDTTIRNTHLVLRRPMECKILGTQPKPLSHFHDRMEFIIAEIEPGQSQHVELEIEPTTAQTMQWTISVLPVTSQEVAMSVQDATLSVQAIPQKSAMQYSPMLQSIEVQNANAIELVQVQVTAHIPPGIDVTKLNRAANIDANSRTIRWTVDRLPAGATELFQFMATAAEAGTIRVPVTVQAFGVPTQNVELTTIVAAESPSNADSILKERR